MYRRHTQMRQIRLPVNGQKFVPVCIPKTKGCVASSVLRFAARRHRFEIRNIVTDAALMEVIELFHPKHARWTFG